MTDAVLREKGDAIEIADKTGFAHLVVTAPEAWTIDGKPVKAKLVVNGSTIELWVDADGAAVLVDPAWIAAGSMGHARGAHTQTVLGNGKVLVTGGLRRNQRSQQHRDLRPVAQFVDDLDSMPTIRRFPVAVGKQRGLMTLSSTILGTPTSTRPRRSLPRAATSTRSTIGSSPRRARAEPSP